MQLAGKVVLISGGSQGIGKEAAAELARAGAKVVIGARDERRLREATEALREHGNVKGMPLDVTQSESVERWVQAALDAHGRIDVVINNAGNGGEMSSFEASSTEALQAMLDVHLLGTERVIRRVLPVMRGQGHGLIVNVVSTVAYVPMPGASGYCAAKAGVIARTRALEGELRGAPVKLALFSPPHTQTEAGAKWPLALPKQFTPSFAAKELVRAVRRERHETLAGGNGSLLFLQRLSPALAQKIMSGIGLGALAKVESEARRLPASSTARS